MRIHRYMLRPANALAQLLLAGGVLVGCTETFEYSGPAGDNSGIYFAVGGNTEWVFGPEEVQTFSFDVVRRDSVQAHTYRLVASDSEMNIPAEVSFAAGQGRATVTATAQLPLSTFRRDVTVAAVEGDRYVYGNPELKLTVSVANNVIECEKETQGNNYISEPVTVYDFGTTEVDGKRVITYGADGFLCDGYMFMFTLDAEGQAVVARQEALYAVPYVDGVTDKYYQEVEGTGKYQAGKVEFLLKYYISGMNLYKINGEGIKFPANYNPLPNVQP